MLNEKNKLNNNDNTNPNEDIAIKIIDINEIIEVQSENENDFNQARVLQIKEDPLSKEKFYYVHFLNLEKRMDRWVSEKIVKKSLGKTEYFEGSSNKNNHYYEKNVLTRKRSSMIGKETHTEKENIENSIKIKNIDKIILGYYEIDTWYFSPYPQEFTTNKILFICEFCLKYMKKKTTLIRHMTTCEFKNPPGKEIYFQQLENTSENELIKDKNRIIQSVSVFEIKGEEHKLFCQNLCLIAKLFLDHKSIYFDVSPFKFYVITENDTNGKHIVAYFSKESSLFSEYNLACIMVLPPYQRKGYGQFLIAMSYYYSKIEKRICTPEIPLSDLGKISYKSYWTITILKTLLKYKGNLSIKELSEETGIKNEDIIYTLNELSLIKYWKGQQVIQTINTKQIEEFLNKKRAGKHNHHKFNSNFILNNNN